MNKNSTYKRYYTHSVAFCSKTTSTPISTIIRIEKTDEIQNWFARHHIEHLSEDAVNRFFILFSNSFDDAIRRYQRTLGNVVGETPFRRIKLFAELLSRLCHRLLPDQLETVFTLAVNIYQNPVFAQNFWLHKSVEILFKRIFEAISPTDVLNWINQLLTLPIPDEGGFRVIEPQKWVEPFERIQWMRNFKLPNGFDRSMWNPAVENLIRITNSGTCEARKRAATRLAWLYQIDALTVEEISDFARAVWSRTHSQTNLPIETNFTTSSLLLSLPNPNIEDTKDSLRRYLTSQDFPRAVQHKVAESGQESIGVGFGGDRNPLIENIIQVTLQTYSKAEEVEKLINWSADETNTFLSKAVDLWDEQKIYLSRFAAGGDLLGDNVRQQFLQLAHLFALVLLPRLADADVKTKESVKRVLNEMEEENLFPLSALPAKLFVAPEEKDEVFSKVLTGLRFTNAEIVGDAAHGTRNWLFFARRSGLAEFPERLLEEIVTIAVLRRQPGLLSVIKILAWITETMPEDFSETQFIDLTATLEFMKIEAFSSGFNSQNEDRENKIVCENEQSAFQDSCWRLANGIKQFYESTGKKLPDVVEFWISHR